MARKKRKLDNFGEIAIDEEITAEFDDVAAENTADNSEFSETKIEEIADEPADVDADGILDSKARKKAVLIDAVKQRPRRFTKIKTKSLPVDVVAETPDVEEEFVGEDTADWSEVLEDWSAKPTARKRTKKTQPELDIDETNEMEDNLGKKQKHQKPALLIFRIFSRILILAAFGAVGYLIYLIIAANILPAQYLALIIAIAVLIAGFFVFKTWRKKTRPVILGILDILAAIILAASVFGCLKFNETINFILNNFETDESTAIYYVVAKNDAHFESLEDLSADNILYAVRDLTLDAETIADAVRSQANGAGVAYEAALDTLAENVLTDSELVIMLNSGHYDQVVEDFNDFENTTKIIGRISIKIEAAEAKSVDDITSTPFVIYLSGIDTRTDSLPTHSLSDVNMAIVVNPLTRKLLLVSIPRDYYVQLHGTTGLKDKLTHAGSLGGVQLSMATIEDFLGIEFNYYVRLNFNSVIRLVDAIGGITIYSEVDYNITSWVNKSCIFYPGYNDVDGECALAFARERHAYSTGDRHRGENQEQIIELILDKVSQSSTLISKYSELLEAVDGTFETSLTSDDILAFVKMNLNDMTKWTVETANLDGTTGMTATYSYPNQNLSVMFPDESTIEAAKEKIQEVLAETL